MGRLGTICCNSSLERKISTSTGQAETYALASLVKDVVWTRHLADDMRRPQMNATELDTDNQGVHIQSTKAINHATANFGTAGCLKPSSAEKERMALYNEC